jgi:hypothetical protein
MSGMFALICMGFFSNAVSDMQAINDQHLSSVIGQSASVSNSADALGFVNFVEQKQIVKISDKTKNADSYIETLDFFSNLSSELNDNPLAPKFSLIDQDDNIGLDLQIGLLKMHFQSIDINGTVSVLSE